MKNKIFWLVILLALVLRLIEINQSMWLDESISANVVKNYSLWQIPSKFSPGDFHPPGFYVTLRLWTDIFGHSVVAMRMMSIIFGLITVFLTYKIGKIVANKKVAIWAMILVAVNPLLIYYSQEIRMYSMATMLLMGAFYFYLKTDKEKNIKNIIFYNLFCLLAFLTFYGSVFFIATLGLIRLFRKEWKKMFVQNIGVILAIILVWPLLSKQMILSKEMLIEVKNWSTVLGKVDIKNLVLIPIKFTSGRISFYPKIVYYLVSGIWAMAVFGGIITGAIKNKILGITAFLPIILGLIFSAFSPMMQYFRFQYLIPILMLLLVKAINKNILKYGITAVFVVFSLMYLLNQNMWREDWHGLAKDVDKKVVMIKSFSDPIDYYKANTEVIDIRKYDFSDKEIQVVPYGEVIHGIDHKQIFEKNAYKLEKKKNFREVVLETWTKQ